MKKAEQFRNRALKVIKSRGDEIVRKVLETIHDDMWLAALAGKLSINYQNEIPDAVIKKLKAEGFVVKAEHQYSYNISW